MCYYLTVAVPAAASSSLERLRREHGYRTLPNDNWWVAEHLPEGVDAEVVFSGQCSCDFVPQESHDPEPALRAAERKYRALGWSESKVRRAMASKAATLSKEPPHRRQADEFRVFLRDLAQEAGKAHLLLHFYSGSAEDERITFAEPVAVPVAVLAEPEWRYPEDRVVTILAGAVEQSAEADEHRRGR